MFKEQKGIHSCFYDYRQTAKEESPEKKNARILEFYR
jgi:hypothetical protein